MNWVISERLHLLSSILTNSYCFCNPSRIPIHVSLVWLISSEESNFSFCLLLYNSSDSSLYESNLKNTFRMLLFYYSRIVPPVLFHWANPITRCQHSFSFILHIYIHIRHKHDYAINANYFFQIGFTGSKQNRKVRWPVGWDEWIRDRELLWYASTLSSWNYWVTIIKGDNMYFIIHC